ncbi:UDP-N-acetylmuramoyl-L-alanine--D-glutamate ligase [Pseudomarimonas arenosa]|uniref:UDP-N-acetylmuramoylalanine--D-glutamate ligase n=1 Tax=Pseudomarimonas arenosa TaxID=2774145 RepID=A0AAW3ZP64_9GAMM|nr:UDP-N-acetylmuramoyl-L-alanine--D-glutamate ligase [Pseudomarimonas arenosa]MBD8526071.1 UDP-N-acetylmuramoyl-L-alanine--D-glutamate ligase [Pseudomarimonas arenosa]
MRVSGLEDQRVALWGFGREGRASWRALRAQFPTKALSLFCPRAEHFAADELRDAHLQVWDEPTLERLVEFDWVIKSPGISAYHPVCLQARERGVHVTSGTGLWFAEQLPGIKLCVTGSKGKSSTTALIAHVLRQRGVLVGLAGNIGLPLLELLNPPLMPAVWAIELSSYQTGDAVRPDVALVLNLYAEHLDWHGNEQRYIEDKLKLITQAQPRIAVLNWQDQRLRLAAEQIDPAITEVRWFGREDGWHLRDDAVCQRAQPMLPIDRLPIAGTHNAANLCAAMAVIEAAGLQQPRLIDTACSFTALPHRLQIIGASNGVRFVDDSIATTPHASIAALRCFAGQPVAILVGGYDRGLDWTPFVEYLQQQPVLRVICRGANGPRIAAQLRQALPNLDVLQTQDLQAAVGQARAALPGGGVVLLSPGAPSFPEFKDYTARGAAFAAAAGFAAEARAIGGLGIA